MDSPFSPSILKPPFPSPLTSAPLFLRTRCSNSRTRGSGFVLKCSAAGHCEYGSSSSSSSLNTPYEPSSSTGIYLSSVLQNQRQIFRSTVADHLKLLDFSMDSAIARMALSSSSDEASLHRRIAEMKEGECRRAVEEAMYMMIVYEFLEMRVPLVPRLSNCIYDGRLEIWPSKTWELESLHSPQWLHFIRDHVSSLVGLRPDASVKDCWATTRIRSPLLFRAYADSLLLGYSLGSPPPPSSSSPASFFNRLTSLISFKNNALLRWEEERRVVVKVKAERKRPRSREAEAVMEMQSWALFGERREEERMMMISTSFSSLKRLLLEAVAFGNFLHDVEDFVGNLFKLKPPTTPTIS